MVNTRQKQESHMDNKVRLNIGCGAKKLDGYINIDVSKKHKPDIVADMRQLPFKSNSVDEIYADNVLEHMSDFVGAMKEMHRVLKKGGKLFIIVPAPTVVSAYIPQHQHYFSYTSFMPFELGDVHDDYYDFHFSKVMTRYTFEFINRIIQPLTDSGHVWVYERTFLSHLFPAVELRAELVK